MPGAWKTARVFISSTFRDMHAERDHLVTDVLPRLREKLEQRRIYLDDIDLRWGVTQEQTRSGLALEVCLQAIDECRPFFLGILGQRYGYVATNVPTDSFLRRAWLRDYDGRSLTELEIIHAVLREPHMKVRAFFYFRDPDALNDVPEARRQSDFAETSPEAIAKLAELQARIRASGYPLFENYPAKWDANAWDRSTRTMGRFTGLQEFGERVYEDLWNALRTEFDLPDEPAAAPADLFAEEHDGHERLMESLLRVYIPRAWPNEKLTAFAQESDGSICVLGGPEGAGKSASLAAFIFDLRKRFPGIAVIAHFAGATPLSTSLEGMKERLCREILAAVLDEQKQARIARAAAGGEIAALRQADIEKEYAVPADPAELTATLRRFILKIPMDRRVMIVLDALDKVQTASVDNLLDWLPEPIPEHVRIVVSCTRSEWDTQTIAAHRDCIRLRMGPLDREFQEEIVRKVPLLWAKALDERQIQLLLDNPACSNPLFLRVALEELHGYGSFQQLTRRIMAFPGRPLKLWERLRRRMGVKSKKLRGPDPLVNLFDQVLERLEESFDKNVVRVTVTYLAAARRGLLERELRELVADLPGAGDLFAILRQLRPHLMSSRGLLNFRHKGLFVAVALRYLYETPSGQRDVYDRLAEYFLRQPYMEPDGGANLRKLDELPWLLLQAGRLDESESLLLTLQFCESKTKAGMVRELAEDFAAATRARLQGASRPAPQGAEYADGRQPMRPLLTLLEEAIRREIAFLTRNPDSFFQCVWNQGWWHDCADAARYYEPPRNGWGPDGPPWSPGDPAATPRFSALLEGWRMEKERETPGFLWLRSLCPLPRRLGTAEKTILHGSPITALACSPDGTLLATAGESQVRVWVLETGEEWRTFAVGRGIPEVGDSIDKIFEREHGTDAESEQEQAWIDEALKAGEEKAECVAWSADGSRLLAGAGQTFYVFDPYAGVLKLKFSVPAGEDYTLGIWPCAAFSPDGSRIALAGAKSQNARVVEAHSGRTLLELAGHSSVRRVSFSPDGLRIVTIGAEPAVQKDPDRLPEFQYSACLWNAYTCRELNRIVGASFMQYSDTGSQIVVATAAELVVLDAATNREIVRHSDPWGEVEREQGQMFSGAGPFGLMRAQERVSKMTMSDDGLLLAIPGKEGGVEVRDVMTNALIAWHCADLGEPSAIAFGWSLPVYSVGDSSEEPREIHPFSHRLMCGFSDGTVRIWKPAEPARVPRLVRESREILDLKFSPTGDVLATVASDLCLRDAATGLELRRLSGCRFVAFDGDGRRIASANWQLADRRSQVCIWEVGSGQLLQAFPGASDANCAAFSPNGRWLVTAGGGLHIWDSETGSEILSITLTAGAAESVAFSPDGRTLATGGSDDRTIRLWDAFSGELLAVYEFPSRWIGIHVHDLAYSTDGRSLFFSSGGGLWVVDAQSGNLKEENLRSVGDTAAFAADTRFPWCALRPLLGDGDTFVHSGLTGARVAAFPAPFTKIATHPGGRIFAGAVANDLFLFALEGEQTS
jgi:WD40 repeat protein